MPSGNYMREKIEKVEESCPNREGRQPHSHGSEAGACLHCGLTPVHAHPKTTLATERAATLGVMRAWTRQCTMRMQAVLVTATRGCDGRPREDVSKTLVWALRYDVLHPSSDEETPKAYDAFMGYKSGLYQAVPDFINDLDGYPFHFVQHLAHAAHILAVYHFDIERRQYWKRLYEGIIVEGFHCTPETDDAMKHRLRDR